MKDRHRTPRRRRRHRIWNREHGQWLSQTVANDAEVLKVLAGLTPLQAQPAEIDYDKAGGYTLFFPPSDGPDNFNMHWTWEKVPTATAVSAFMATLATAQVAFAKVTPKHNDIPGFTIFYPRSVSA